MREAEVTHQVTVDMSILGNDIPQALYWWLRFALIGRPDARVRFDRTEVATLHVFIEETYDLGGPRSFELAAEVDLSAFINDAQCQSMARGIVRDFEDELRAEKRKVRRRLITCGCGYTERDPTRLCPSCGRSTR